MKYKRKSHGNLTNAVQIVGTVVALAMTSTAALAIDTAGVALGMTKGEAVAAAKAHLSKLGSIKMAEKVYHGTTKTAWIEMSGGDNVITGKDLDTVYISLDPVEGRSYFVGRRVLFNKNAQPEGDTIIKGLVEKFGQPAVAETSFGGPQLIWVSGPDGKLLGRSDPNVTEACKLVLRSTGDEGPQSFHPGCGIAIKAFMRPSNVGNGKLTHSLTVYLVDGRPMLRAMDAQEQQKLDAGSKVIPTL